MRVFNRRLNRSRASSSLVLLFVVTATVFSVLPLLRYLRGHTIFDYELWYATGKHVLAGDEIYFFRAGKYDFMYPPPCALFLAGASLLGQGELIFLLVAINSAAWFCSAKVSALLARGDQRITNPWLYLIPSLLLFLLLILPAPFRGFERAWHDLEKWSAGMLKYSEVTVGQRPMRSYTWKNQSLIGVGNRLLRHVDADAASAPHKPVYVNLADLSFPVVNAIMISVALALGVVFIAAMPNRDMRTAESDAIEFALLLLLMLMLTPLSFGYFYSWLMLPFAVVTQRALTGKGSAVFWWTLPALMLLALGLAFPRRAQLHGNTFFATLLLFIGLSVELLRFKRQRGHG